MVCSSVDRTGMGKPDGGHSVRAEQAYEEVLDAVWESIECSRLSKGAASKPYFIKGYVETARASTQTIPRIWLQQSRCSKDVV